jgi:hypothetical protein
VNYLSRPWHRPVLRVLVLALAVAVAPLPAWAAESTAPPPGTNLKASIQKVVAKEIAATVKTPVAQAKQAGAEATTDLGSPSFFKSKAGLVALVFTTVGLGFCFYSTSHDRVKSPGK